MLGLNTILQRIQFTYLYNMLIAPLKRGELDESYPVLASYLHIIPMTDSIEVLISNGRGAPASLLLRSAFEGKFTVGYI